MTDGQALWIKDPLAILADGAERVRLYGIDQGPGALRIPLSDAYRQKFQTAAKKLS